MTYMKYNESAVLEEFGRAMQEKDALKKTAQLVSLSDEEKQKLQAFIYSLAAQPAQGPGMEKWIKRLSGQADPYLKMVHDALAKKYQLWSDGKSPQEVAAVLVPTMAHPESEMASKTPPMQKYQALSVRDKVAGDQKNYDVFPKEDIVHDAHPKSAVVSGDVVENLNEQQKADLAVAEKSATKKVLTLLYKLAKQLRDEKHVEAYKLVKATIMDISKDYKKGV